MKFLVSQIKLILTGKSAILTYGIIFLFVMINYFQNVFTYRGRDVVQMYHPMGLTMLTGGNVSCNCLLLLYPFLVVLAAGWSYYEDHATGQQLFWVSRIGRKKYYAGKIVAVFFATFLIFTVPVFLEMILNMIAFPAGAAGDISNLTIYDEALREGMKKYMWYDLYLHSRYLYVVFHILLWGIVSGVLASFTVALSFLNVFKFRIFLFLPVYVMIYVLYYRNCTVKESLFSTYFADYLTYYDVNVKSVPALVEILLFLILVACCCTAVAVRKDVLNR